MHVTNVHAFLASRRFSPSQLQLVLAGCCPLSRFRLQQQQLQQQQRVNELLEVKAVKLKAKFSSQTSFCLLWEDTTSNSPIKKTPHRCALQLVSGLNLDSVKTSYHSPNLQSQRREKNVVHCRRLSLLMSKWHGSALGPCLLHGVGGSFV